MTPPACTSGRRTWRSTSTGTRTPGSPEMLSAVARAAARAWVSGRRPPSRTSPNQPRVCRYRRRFRAARTRPRRIRPRRRYRRPGIRAEPPESSPVGIRLESSCSPLTGTSLAGVVEQLRSAGVHRRQPGGHHIGDRHGCDWPRHWLPGPDGTFHRPADFQLDDLPPEYKRDEALAKALGMIQPVVAEASRQLGLPPELLRGLSEPGPGRDNSSASSRRGQPPAQAPGRTRPILAPGCVRRRKYHDLRGHPAHLRIASPAGLGLAAITGGGE